jgi:hypothetical protein
MVEADKRYHDDWAKVKSRTLVKDMIERALLPKRRPSNLYVLCFPGIDAREIYEVYDPLGIPRENIVGLERDQAIAKELEAKRLGIKVVPKSLDEYLGTLRQSHFDVVSLDYTGPVRADTVNTLHAIRQKQFKSEWVLHHANLARRDPNGHRFHLFGTGGMWGGERIHDSFEDAAKNGESDLSSYKSDAYTGLLLMGLHDPTKRDYARLRTFIVGKDQTQFIEEVRHAAHQHGLPESEFDPLDIESSFLDRYIENIPAGAFLCEKVLKEMIMRKINVLYKGLKVEHMLHLLREGVQESKRFRPFDATRYSYISESGSPMAGDIYALREDTDTLKQARRLVRFHGYPSEFKFRLTDGKSLAEDLVGPYNQARKRALLPYIELTKGSLAPGNRSFLGSSAKPVLTKGRAIDEFRTGSTVDQIREKYRGCNGKPLAQWKAHVTMGTYDASPRDVRETIAEDAENSGLERITKDEALELLSAGVPPREINDTYPTSFTVGQLAAFKAWQTMRKTQ